MDGGWKEAHEAFTPASQAGSTTEVRQRYAFVLEFTRLVSGLALRRLVPQAQGTLHWILRTEY